MTRRLTLATAGIAVVALHAAGTVLPRPADPDLLFGLDRWRALGFPLPGGALFAGAAAVLLALLLLPRAAEGAARAAGRLRAVSARAGAVLVVAAAGAVTWLLPNYTLSGDASSVLLFTAMGNVYPSNALTSWLFAGADLLLGADPAGAIRLVSTLAGMVYAGAAVAIGRECFEAGPRRAGLTAVLLTAGTAALFFGTLEVYAPVAAATALYLLFGLRWLNGKGRGIAPPLVLGVAFVLHGLAGLLLPSLLALANRGRLRPVAARRMVGWGAVFLLPVLLAFGALWNLTWHGRPPDAGPLRTGTFLGVGDRAPLMPLTLSDADPTRRYAVLDPEHLAGLLNLYALVALPGLALLAAGRRGKGDPAFRFVAAAAAFLVLFPVFWNISYDLRSDWDLFSTLGIPLALLGGLAFFAERRTGAEAARAAALSIFCLLPVVLSNHLSVRARVVYAQNVGDILESAAVGTAARETVDRVFERAGEREPRPPGATDRQWRSDLERLAIALIQRSGGFRPEGPALPDAELSPAAARALAAVDPDAPPEVAARLAARTMLGPGASPGEEERLVGLFDRALDRAAARALRYPEVDLAPAREAAARVLAASFPNPTGGFVPSRWADLMADALREVVGTTGGDGRWRRLATRRMEWAPRSGPLARRRLAQVTGDPAWLDALAGIELLRGRKGEAREFLYRAIDAEPSSLVPRIRLANELIDGGDFAEAERILARGLRIAGHHAQAPAALYQLAWLRDRRGEWRLAVPALREALDRLSRAPATPENRDLERRAREMLARLETE